jgi:hypothetical protein
MRQRNDEKTVNTADPQAQQRAHFIKFRRSAATTDGCRACVKAQTTTP